MIIFDVYGFSAFHTHAANNGVRGESSARSDTFALGEGRPGARAKLKQTTRAPLRAAHSEDGAC